VPERTGRDPVELGVATQSRPGEAVNGDLAVVRLLPEGALVAAIDGVGHGYEAAHAARRAGDVVRDKPSRDLILLVERCHSALQDTRGAAISLAFVSSPEGTVTWLGVGGVAGRVLIGDPSASRPQVSLAPRSGIAGHELPDLTTATLDLRRGDVLVLATDGIEAAFGDSLDLSGSPQAIAERILAAHARPTDDALVVALRYLGPRP
jgi:negative regulator of sigma-B (phosphoserine phosphatase)